MRKRKYPSSGNTGKKPYRCNLECMRIISGSISDKLFEHCAEIDETARNRMELIVRSLAEQNGVTEQLKAENQMEWVRQMNACKAQAEEIVKAELIYD